ncbi:MAG: hypothetical protein EAZ92_09650 [Candidatus Kapaibacterium sp.]|nr:MAG: hypothetical protein EAZ92_09650 [Candidatus Kapabacteria bacterium]
MALHAHIPSAKAQSLRPTQKVETPTSPQNGDEIWEELLARPESDAFLKMLSMQAHQDFLDGNTEEGGFSDEDEHEIKAH